MHSRLMKLLLAALAAAVVAPAAAPASMITYIDGKNVWVASPDGQTKRQITTDGTNDAPYHVPSADDAGNVLAVAGGLTNSKMLVHVTPAGRRTVNVIPWKVGTLPNFGPYTMRMRPDGKLLAYKYVLNQGAYQPLVERLSIAMVNSPAVPGAGTFDQAGSYWTPTWIDDKLVVAQDGVAKLEMEPGRFTQFLAVEVDGLEIAGAEVSRDKSRYLLDIDNKQNGQSGLVLYAHTGAFPGGEVTGGCQVPAAGSPEQTWGLSPDGRQVVWQDSGGVKVGTFDPARQQNGWCVGEVVTISATGSEPTFGAATLTGPQEPAPPPPPVVEEPPATPAPQVSAPVTTQKPRGGTTKPATIDGKPVARTTGDAELALSVPATVRSVSLRSGLRVAATAPGAGKIAVTLTAGGRKLGSATKTVGKAGKVTLKLKPTKAGRKALRRLKGRKATLKIVFTPKRGGDRLTSTARVTLK